MNRFYIRNANSADLPEILGIYEKARQFMKENGNESQWGLPDSGKECWPSKDSVISRIENKILYLCETEVEEKTEIAAVFAFTNGIPEPVYSTIFEGEWPDDGSVPYGVIHCFASSGIVKGAGTFCLEWALKQCGYMKIDTHPNNKPMISLLEKNDFTYCGKVRFPKEDLQNDDVIRVAFFKSAPMGQ